MKKSQLEAVVEELVSIVDSWNVDAQLGIFYAGIAKYGHDSLDSQICWDLISQLQQRDLFALVEIESERREAV